MLDKAAAKLYIANEDAGTASITDVKANRVIASFAVGLEPEGAAISPDGRWVYITSESSSTVSVIDTQTNQVVTTFLVGARPREAVLTPDSSRAHVTAENGNTVSVVDTKNHQVIKVIDLPRGDVSVIDTAANKVIATIKGWGRPLGHRALSARCEFKLLACRDKPNLKAELRTKTPLLSSPGLTAFLTGKTIQRGSIRQKPRCVINMRQPPH